MSAAILKQSFDECVQFLVEEAGRLHQRLQRRCLFGIAGGPGVGKSTIAAAVVALINARCPGRAVLIPMDGFHMRQSKLNALGIAAAKGAPHTFEAAAFGAFLARLKSADGPVSGPSYSRRIEDVIDDAFVVDPQSSIVIVEGNYLLLDETPWIAVRQQLDETVFMGLDRDVARERLLKRRMAEGLFTLESTLRHVEDVDLANYDLVQRTRLLADIQIELDAIA